MAKKWYASKTIWVNAIAIFGTLLMFLFPSISAADWAQFSVAILGVVNLVLRIVTKDAINLGLDPKTGDGGAA